MLLTKYTNKDTQREVSFESPYKIVCNGVKKTSIAKKVTPHRIDAFFNLPKNTIDISIEARLQRKLRREFMDAKMKEGRRKKTIK